MWRIFVQFGESQKMVANDLSCNVVDLWKPIGVSAVSSILQAVPSWIVGKQVADAANKFFGNPRIVFIFVRFVGRLSNLAKD